MPKPELPRCRPYNVYMVDHIVELVEAKAKELDARAGALQAAE